MFASDSLDTPAAGMRAALPIIAAYVLIGFAAGVVGVAAGLSPAEVGLLSLLVFAGSAQFIFADLIATSPLTLVTTVFLINFRHFLYSTSLAQKIHQLPLVKRAAIGAQLTDETFGVASVLCRREQTAAGGLFTLNVTSYTAWFIGNICGALASDWLPLADLGADFLLVAMFAGLLMLMITAGETSRRNAVIVAAIAGSGIVCLELLFTNPLNIILVAAVAAAAGAILGGGVTSVTSKAEG